MTDSILAPYQRVVQESLREQEAFTAESETRLTAQIGYVDDLRRRITKLTERGLDNDVSMFYKQRSLQ